MAKKFDTLRKNMNPARRKKAEAGADRLLKEAMAIDDLRRSLKLTQEQIALALKVNQGAVSQMENQADMYISTLRRIIEAMGGELELVAHFPSGEAVVIDQFKEQQ